MLVIGSGEKVEEWSGDTSIYSVLARSGLKSIVFKSPHSRSVTV